MNCMKQGRRIVGIFQWEVIELLTIIGILIFSLLVVKDGVYVGLSISSNWLILKSVYFTWWRDVRLRLSGEPWDINAL